MLNDMEKTISMATLARNPERIALDIELAGTVYRITRRGRRTMLLMDHQYFERWVATFELIQQHPNWEEELAQGRRDIAEGRGIDLDDIRRELGLDRPANTKGRRSVTRIARTRSRKGR